MDAVLTVTLTWLEPIAAGSQDSWPAVGVKRKTSYEKPACGTRATTAVWLMSSV